MRRFDILWLQSGNILRRQNWSSWFERQHRRAGACRTLPGSQNARGTVLVGSNFESIEQDAVGSPAAIHMTVPADIPSLVNNKRHRGKKGKKKEKKKEKKKRDWYICRHRVEWTGEPDGICSMDSKYFLKDSSGAF